MKEGNDFRTGGKFFFCKFFMQAIGPEGSRFSGEPFTSDALRKPLFTGINKLPTGRLLKKVLHELTCTC